MTETAELTPGDAETLIPHLVDTIGRIVNTNRAGDGRLIAFNKARSLCGEHFGAEGLRLWDAVMSEVTARFEKQ